MASAFFDTNVLLYLASDDAAKASRAEDLLADGGTGCDALFTEDMKHGRVIDGVLKICNPFVR